MENVCCDFCDFSGNKTELLKNGHCPKCNSPKIKPVEEKDNTVFQTNIGKISI